MTNMMLKEIPQYATLAIMHLFNWMVRSSVFPSEFKVSRILPLKKKDKPSSALDSFRPVNNMNPIEKILEQLMKDQLDKFFKDKEIIPPYHHGSRRGHSTITATQVIQNTLSNNQDRNLFSSVLMTDLGSALDSVDHHLLSEKLCHVGVRGKSGALLKSFLSERRVFTEIQGYTSNMKTLGNKSVVQGSRLAS